ncbi:uncharacterized protein LOC109602826 [Aethina tumida]|uniref:uncharacterized protein LOC109602826 n=1 Tax=Aethina tumida TaxID=116153 RepID=UPI0021484897|nr:uncharacterized protein LOC109602826 [Aethina tumida]
MVAIRENKRQNKKCPIQHEVVEYSQNASLNYVLNGGYPKNEIVNMDLYDLELFVDKLIVYTNKLLPKSVGQDVNNRPKWWPNALEFDSFYAKNGVKKRRPKASILQKLVIKCSRFFKKYSYNYKTCQPFNDENSCRTANLQKKGASNKPNQPLVRRNLRLRKMKKIECPIMKLPIVRLEDIMKPPAPLNKEQFLKKFNLVPDNKQSVSNPPSQPPSISQSVRLRTTINIPLSSEIGKKLLKRENHQVPQDVILRRLERVEWYVNKNNNEPSMSSTTLRPSIPQAPDYCHTYKFPKRQHHQMKHYHKLLNFCRPVSVVLECCNMHKLKERYEKELKENGSKELVVYLDKQPKELTGSQENIVERKLRKRTLSMSIILVPLDSGGEGQTSHKEDNRKKLVMTLEKVGTKEASTDRTVDMETIPQWRVKNM